MRNFTLRKGFLESKCESRSSFKGFVMLVVMMLMMANSAMAQEVKFEVIDGLRYSLDAGTKTATLMPKTDGLYSGDIIIPEKVEGHDGLEYVVSSFGASCFSGCKELTSIAIPSSVTSLGASCFSGCWGLTSITIPPLVTSLGLGCFSGCWGLTSITIPSSVISLGDYCFYYCSGLTSITIPSSVTSLGDDCFEGCSGLTSITIPPLVTSLGDCCFFSCSGLTSITIPSSVTSLGWWCFSDCSGLTSITIPSSVTSLGYDCFSDCKNLETVYFKGKKCDSNYKDLKIPTTSIIKVPKEYLQEYKEAFGSDYQYIFVWNPDEQEKITSRLLHVLHHQSLTNPAS